MATSYEMPRATPVIVENADVRATFIKRTYFHLFGALAAFVLFEMFLFSTGIAVSIARAMLSVSWLLVLGGFIAVGWLASRMAFGARSLSTQYAALALFVIAEGIIFVPLLYLAEMRAPGVIQSAALVTMAGFSGLTFIVVRTGKDFSFLGGVLRWGLVIALVLIAAAVIFGFHLGTIFSVVMIALAGAAILYDTSAVLYHYPSDRYVGAALQLLLGSLAVLVCAAIVDGARLRNPGFRVHNHAET